MSDIRGAKECKDCKQPIADTGFYVHKSSGKTIYHVRKYCQTCSPREAPQTSVVVERSPPNAAVYIALSVVSTVCCCCPFGFVALVFAVMAQCAVDKGNYEAAQQHTTVSMVFNIMAILCWFLILIIILTYVDEKNTERHIHDDHDFLRKRHTFNLYPPFRVVPMCH